MWFRSDSEGLPSSDRTASTFAEGSSVVEHPHRRFERRRHLGPSHGSSKPPKLTARLTQLGPQDVGFMACGVDLFVARTPLA